MSVLCATQSAPPGPSTRPRLPQRRTCGPCGCRWAVNQQCGRFYLFLSSLSVSLQSLLSSHICILFIFNDLLCQNANESHQLVSHLLCVCVCVCVYIWKDPLREKGGRFLGTENKIAILSRGFHALRLSVSGPTIPICSSQNRCVLEKLPLNGNLGNEMMGLP